MQDLSGRRQLRDYVMEHLKRSIISGEFALGASIPLADVATELDVSLTPVREALLLLMQDGWVVQEPNRGFRVAPITRQDVADTYLVNTFVMGELAARAATRITDDGIRELREIDAKIKEAAEVAPTQIEGLNLHLHATINRTARSRRLGRLALTLARLDPRPFWAEMSDWIEHSRAGHGPIIAALERGDVEDTRRLMVAHVLASRDILLRDMESRGFWASNNAVAPDTVGTGS